MNRSTLGILAGWACWCGGMALAWADSTVLDAGPALRASAALRQPAERAALKPVLGGGLTLKPSTQLGAVRPLADVNALVAASPSAAGPR